MAKLKTKRNPFKPGTTTRPAYLAGRHNELEVIKETLEEIADLHEPQEEDSLYRGPLTPIKIVGPRGVGKTTLLAEARKMAKEMKIHVLSIARLPHLAHPELLIGLIGEKAYDNLKAKLSRVQGASVASLGVSLAQEEIGLQQRFRKKMKKQPLLLLMDEAMHYDPQALGEMLQICQALIGEECPLAVVLAGTPKLDPLLERVSASFIDRSNDIYINALSGNETLEALGKPFELSGIKVEAAALRRMAKLTDNYPYFIQIVGKQVWKAMLSSGKQKVSLEMVQKAEPEIKHSRKIFYEKIYAKMDRAGLIEHASHVMGILRQNQGKDQRRVIIEGLEHTVPDGREKRWEVFDQLKDHGFIWEKVGWVEAGIPSFFNYCQQKAKEAARSKKG